MQIFLWRWNEEILKKLNIYHKMKTTYIDYNNIIEINVFDITENLRYYYTNEERSWFLNRIKVKQGWYKFDYGNNYYSELPSKILKENLIIDNILYIKPRVVISTVVGKHVIYFETIDEAKEYAKNIINGKFDIKIE